MQKSHLKKTYLQLVAMILALYPATSSADLTDAPPAGTLTVDSIIPIFERILTIAWGVFVAISIAMFLWAAFLFITAHGEATQVGNARKAVIWGIVGLIVAFFAFSITGIIKTVLGL